MHSLRRRATGSSWHEASVKRCTPSSHLLTALCVCSATARSCDIFCPTRSQRRAPPGALRLYTHRATFVQLYLCLSTAHCICTRFFHPHLLSLCMRRPCGAVREPADETEGWQVEEESEGKAAGRMFWRSELGCRGNSAPFPTPTCPSHESDCARLSSEGGRRMESRARRPAAGQGSNSSPSR
jgi:hypothetical protein